jgi:hypothetical protein
VRREELTSCKKNAKACFSKLHQCFEMSYQVLAKIFEQFWMDVRNELAA